MQISGTMQTPGERRGVSPPVTMPYQRAYAQPFQHEAICRSMKLRNGLHKLFCDLSAIELAETYRRRWTIETHFQFLTQSLHCEVAGLGKPRAALFLFAMALVAGNALAVVRASLRQAHGREAEAEVSGYYLANEMAASFRAVNMYAASLDWTPWRHISP